jgi:serine/threonine protein kinase
MAIEHTQAQSAADEQRSKQLSLQRATPPTEVPGYEAQRLLGVGAYGEVWVGADKNTGRRVAIKFYAHRRGVDWSLLSREVEKLVFLSADRYVVQLLDVGWNADPPYYIMEYIERGSLEDVLREQGALPVIEAVELIREIALGLSHAHGKGVLHCDLKPANILLDNDRRPRLADFGQSRLTTEQRPALGTLFYMAPEQADLEAVPDVRWDVYALGAILYCLLVGEPPHRSEDSVSQLETARDLTDRLARYRQVIRSSPLPREHRRVPGVDKPLADIVDRCLAPHPRDRFDNVQEVLDALDARQAGRARRPLLVLGLAAPLLLCLVMAVFGFYSYKQIQYEAEKMALEQALENNRATARLAGEKVHNEITRYFNLIEREADKSDLRNLMLKVLDGQALAEVKNDAMTKEERPAVTKNFIEDPERRALNSYIEGRIEAYVARAKVNEQSPKFSSFLVLDNQGTNLAAAYDEKETITQSIGANWAFRTYFHGQKNDLPRGVRPEDAAPTNKTVLSGVFQSTSTKRWKVAFSTPILAESGDPETQIGVLSFTMNLGDLAFVRTADVSQDRFAVLVDGRGGEAQGTILQHPIFDQLLDSSPRLPDRITEKRIVFDADGSLSTANYTDPFEEEPEAVGLHRNWLAATARVPGFGDASPDDSGLVVLFQEDKARVIAPVKNISEAMLRLGAGALGVIAVVSVGMWLLAVGPLRGPRLRPSSNAPSGESSSPPPRVLAQTTTVRQDLNS